MASRSVLTRMFTIAFVLMITRPAVVHASGQSDSSSTDGSSIGSSSQTSSSGKGKSSTSNGASDSSKQGSSTDGSTATSQVYFESQYLSYMAIDRISARIATDICTNTYLGKGAKVFIYDPSTFANLQFVSGFRAQVKILGAAFKSFSAEADMAGLESKLLMDIGSFSEMATSATPTPPPSIPERVLTALGPYITASTTDKSSQVTPSDAALALNIVRYITATDPNKCHGGTPVIYPHLGLPIPEKTSEPSFDVEKVMADLFTLQRKAASIVQKIDDKHTKLKLDEPVARPLLPAEMLDHEPTNSSPAIQIQPPGISSAATSGTPGHTPSLPGSGGSTQDQQKSGLTPKTYDGADYQSFSGASGLLNQILASYTQPLPGGSVPAMASLAQGYKLLDALSGKNAYLLFVEGTAAGGTQRIRKNLFTNIFSGDLIRYSGGAIVTYGLLDLESAQIVGANVYRYVIPYSTITRPTDIGKSVPGDNTEQ
jgi:hypothetical protein